MLFWLNCVNGEAQDYDVTVALDRLADYLVKHPDTPKEDVKDDLIVSSSIL